MIVKYVKGRKKRYKNAAVFNRECSTRNPTEVCTLQRLHCKRGGGGVATVSTSFRGRGNGTWRLHFADCGILKRHLKKRVDDPRGRLK